MKRSARVITAMRDEVRVFGKEIAVVERDKKNGKKAIAVCIGNGLFRKWSQFEEEMQIFAIKMCE